MTTAATPLSVAALAKRQGLSAHFTKTQHVVRASLAEWKRSFLKHSNQSLGEKKHEPKLILKNIELKCFFMISTLFSTKSYNYFSYFELMKNCSNVLCFTTRIALKPCPT